MAAGDITASLSSSIHVIEQNKWSEFLFYCQFWRFLMRHVKKNQYRDVKLHRSMNNCQKRKNYVYSYNFLEFEYNVLL